jgi:hypothetical protein
MIVLTGTAPARSFCASPQCLPPMISGFFVQTHQAVIPFQETKKPAVVAGAGFAILWMLTLCQ